MFTGLIGDVGTLESLESSGDGARLRIATGLGAQIAAGDSVAVSGVCLTATEVESRRFDAEAMNQTLGRTTLGRLGVGAKLNLELAMRADDRLGGHILSGHVDGLGELIAVEGDGFSRRLRVGLGRDLIRYAVTRGSIALDGVSLTISGLGGDWAEVSLIPATLERTNLGDLSVGDRLNVECDILAKYVERLVSPFGGKEQA